MAIGLLSLGCGRAPAAPRGFHKIGDGFEIDSAPFHARVDGNGLELRAHDGSARLAWTGIDQVAPTLLGSRAQRSQHGLTEWMRLDPRGVEQGFTFEKAPATAPALHVVVAVSGTLHPRQVGGAIALVDAHERTVLSYGELAAKDAHGHALPSRFGVDGDHITIDVDARNAVYPVDIDPLVVGADQVSPEPSPNAELGYYFPSAVAMSGNTALAGDRLGGPRATNGNYSGAVFAFTLTGGAWAPQEIIPPAPYPGFETFGTSVAIDGTTAVIGSNSDNTSNNAYVYVNNGGTWQEQGNPLTPASTDSTFAISVAVSGDTAVIGSNGHPYIFRRSGTSWFATSDSPLASPAGSTTTFGSDVKVYGDTVVVADPSSGAGGVYIYQRNGTTFPLLTKLPLLGITSVAIGAPGVSGKPTIMALSSSGSLYSIDLVGGVWTSTAVLPWAGTLEGMDLKLALSVAIEGDTAVVGTFGRTLNATPRGIVIFARVAGTWTEQQFVPINRMGADTQGNHGVGTSGSWLIAAELMQSKGSAVHFMPIVSSSPAPCTASAGCSSGFCVDGVCCTSACTNSCQSCLMADTGVPDGTCGPRLAGSTTPVCGGTCAGGAVTGNACTPAGTCAPVPSGSCGAYACNAAGDGCNIGCSSDSDCAAGSICNVTTHTCGPVLDGGVLPDLLMSVDLSTPSVDMSLPQPDDGVGCTSSSECLNGYSCNTSTHVCEVTMAGKSKSGGCAVASTANGSPLGMLLTAMGLAALLLRRRKARG